MMEARRVPDLSQCTFHPAFRMNLRTGESFRFEKMIDEHGELIRERHEGSPFKDQVKGEWLPVKRVPLERDDIEAATFVIPKVAEVDIPIGPEIQFFSHDGSPLRGDSGEAA